MTTIPNKLTIATRQSPLALWQANFVKAALEQRYPSMAVELLLLTTQGDKILDTPLAKIGGKGLFVKELEQALFDGRADIAVHSLKDVPMQLPEGLIIGRILNAIVRLTHLSVITLPVWTTYLKERWWGLLAFAVNASYGRIARICRLSV